MLATRTSKPRPRRAVRQQAAAPGREERLLRLEHTTTHVLAGGGDPAAAIRAVLRAVCETLCWECGQYWRLDEAAGMLAAGEFWSAPGSELRRICDGPRNLNFAPGVGLLGRVLQSVEPVWVADVSRDARVARTALVRDLGAHGAFIAPVLLEGKPVGAMAFSSRRLSEPDARLLETIGVIGYQVGQFLKRRQAEEEQARLHAAISRDIRDRIAAEQSLRESEARFRGLTELSSDMYWEQDAQYRFTRFVGIGSQAQVGDLPVIGKTRWEREYVNMTPRAWAAHIAQLDARKTFRDLELCSVDQDGRKVWISTSGAPVFDSQGAFLGYHGVARDISERKRTEEALRASEARFRSLTRLSSDTYWEQDAQFRFTAFSGFASEEANARGLGYIGKRRWELNYVNMSAARWARHIAVLEAHLPFRDLELCRLDSAGQPVWISVAGEPVFDATGVFQGYRGVGRDITKKKLDEERIQYLASHDPLTSLPNRAMFSELVGTAIHSARRQQQGFAVLFIDLDGFKAINDTLGHEAGDTLLREASARIRATVRASDVVARLGGDEFVVLARDVNSPEQVGTVAAKILGVLLKPVPFSGEERRVSASIGIAMCPSDAQDEMTLMKNADVAMYRAKQAGKNAFRFYSQGAGARV